MPATGTSVRNHSALSHHCHCPGFRIPCQHTSVTLAHPLSCGEYLPPVFSVQMRQLTVWKKLWPCHSSLKHLTGYLQHLHIQPIPVFLRSFISNHSQIRLLSFLQIGYHFLIWFSLSYSLHWDSSSTIWFFMALVSTSPSLPLIDVIAFEPVFPWHITEISVTVLITGICGDLCVHFSPSWLPGSFQG